MQMPKDDTQEIILRLRHAYATASNDDMSKPGTQKRARHCERLAAISDAINEIESLRQGVVTFCVLWATTYARERGLPNGHLDSAHYDLLKSCGARMVAFTRADISGG